MPRRLLLAAVIGGLAGCGSSGASLSVVRDHAGNVVTYAP